MILSEKLYQLRTASGLSQEELAEKMNVSRQSISKWEIGSSIPGIDKILELSKFYGVSTDFLLQDELEEFPKEVVVRTGPDPDIRTVTLDEANEYLTLVKDSAQKIALGVLMCILSVVPLLALDGFSIAGNMNEDLAVGIGAAILICIVAMAVVIFILSGIKLAAYDYLQKEVFRLEYGVSGVIEKEEKNFLPTFAKGISIGVALCIVSVAPLLVANDALLLYMLSMLLVIVAVGVYIIVRVSVQKAAYSNLLQKGDYNTQLKKKSKKLEAFSTAYWCIVTAVYLGISFLYNNWQISWVIWPVTAVLYSAVYAILGFYMDDDK